MLLAQQKIFFCLLVLWVLPFQACRTALTPPAKLAPGKTSDGVLGQPLSLNDQDFVFSLGLGHQNPWVAFGHHVLENQELTFASWEKSAFHWRTPLHLSEFDCLDVRFSPKDDEIATASTDGMLRVFHKDKPQPQTIFFEGFPLTRVAYHPNEKWIALGSADGFVRILDRSDLRQVAQKRVSHSRIRGLVFETDNFLLVADEMGTLHRLTLSTQTPNAFDVRAFRSDTPMVSFLSRHAKGPLRTSWNLNHNLPIVRSQWAQAQSNERISITTTQGQREVSLGSMSALDIGPWRFNEITVAICDSCLPKDIDLLLPDTRPWGFRLFANETTSVVEVESLPQNENGLTRPNYEAIDKGQSLTEVNRFQLPGPATDLVIRRDLSKALVTFSHLPAVRSVQVYESEVAGLLPLPSPQSGALLFNLTQWTPGQTYIGHRGFTVTGALSPDGHLVATGGWDNRLLIFDAHSGAQLEEKEHAGILQKVRFSGDNKVLAVGLWSPGSTWRQNPGLLLYPLNSN